MSNSEALEFEIYLTSRNKTLIIVDSYDSLRENIRSAYNTNFDGNKDSIWCRLTKDEEIIDSSLIDNCEYNYAIVTYVKNNYKCVFYLKITLSLYILVKNELQDLQSHLRLNYSTIDGLNDDFYEQLKWLIRHHFRYDQSIRYYLTYSKQIRFELTEENIFNFKIFSILFIRPKDYKSVELIDVENLIKLPRAYNTNTKYTISNLISEILTDNDIHKSDYLKSIVNNNGIIIPEFDSILAHVIQGLLYIAKCLPKDTTVYNEWTREMMINYFLLSAMSFDGDNAVEESKVSLSVAYKMESGGARRVGYGPFDYFVSAPEAGAEAGTAVPVVPVIILTVKDQTPYIDSDVGDDSDTIKYQHSTVPKPKVDLDSYDLERHLPQLIAQMLDALSIQQQEQQQQQREQQHQQQLVTSRKRDRNDQPISEAADSNNNIQMVKGILTNGHHTLFFSLSQADSPSRDEPRLHYYGRYTINILPNKCNQYARQDINDESNYDEIVTLLRALYLFARSDVA